MREIDENDDNGIGSKVCSRMCMCVRLLASGGTSSFQGIKLLNKELLLSSLTDFHLYILGKIF